MSVLDRAKAHFQSQELKRIEVPEWADEQGNPTVLFSEPFTLKDSQGLAKFAKEDGAEFVVRLIIMKAINEDGSKAFDISDKPALMNTVDPNVLNRIAAEISKAKDVEEMAGN
jgi:hypothetical protein